MSTTEKPLDTHVVQTTKALSSEKVAIFLAYGEHLVEARRSGKPVMEGDEFLRKYKAGEL